MIDYCFSLSRGGLEAVESVGADKFSDMAGGADIYLGEETKNSEQGCADTNFALADLMKPEFVCQVISTKVSAFTLPIAQPTLLVNH